MQDRVWLSKAEALLWANVGKTAPNPAVAALLVKNNQIIAQGLHIAAGTKHAEQLALENCTSPEGATLYVTLEPCSHVGKTAACTSIIINSGVARVVFACKDINPNVAGSGAEVLKANNIECLNLNTDFAQAFYQAFFAWSKYQTASITLKVAVDKDMNMADDNGKALAITSKIMHQKVAHWRAFHDAILTTDTTIENDNPRLNARLAVTEAKKLIILATKDIFYLSQHIFTTAESIHIFLPKGLHLKNSIADKVSVTYFDGVFADWQFIIKTLAELGLHKVWVEVGSNTARYLIENSIADDILFLEGKTRFNPSRYNLRDVDTSRYPISKKYNLNKENILHIGRTEFPGLFISEERICLPG